MRQSRILFAATISAGTLALGAPVPAHADLVVNKLTGFTSPSGNVGCMIDVDYVRCDILQRDWEPPPRPADCPSFTGYGQGITLSPGSPAEFVCAGDTALAGGPALEYGESVSGGPIRCTSSPSGMTCRESVGGHGFSIAREGYQIY